MLFESSNIHPSSSELSQRDFSCIPFPFIFFHFIQLFIHLFSSSSFFFLLLEGGGGRALCGILVASGAMWETVMEISCKTFFGKQLGETIWGNH